ncbi:MAG: sulfite exporter TauE/SafE family protein [Caldimicrobium sp.]|nr:sulfite exporter TauE/SafE family protein [Caldimicrobium sp.]
MEVEKPIFLILAVSGFMGGFGHCIGMCGPLMLFLSSVMEGLSLWDRVRVYVFYHLGRALSYAFVGGFMAFLGSFLAGAEYLEPFQRILVLLVSLLLIVMGLLLILRRKPRFIRLLFKVEALSVRMANLIKSGGLSYLFPAGILNGLLPCGLSYAGFIAVSALGVKEKIPLVAFAKGFLALLIFGLATIPSLLLVSEATFKGKTFLREKFNYLAGILLIIAGAYFIWSEFIR